VKNCLIKYEDSVNQQQNKYNWDKRMTNLNANGHSRKHPYHPHGGNRKLTPLPPLDVLIHSLLSETIFSPLPLRTAEISSVGEVWIFYGMIQFGIMSAKNI
jgi:hypothetical protein